MRKAEIDALMRAHGRRAGAVASLHVLRQSSLEPDDQAFLTDHAGELNSLDLLRWWARCEEGRTALVMQQIARLAVDIAKRLDCRESNARVVTTSNNANSRNS